MWTVCVTNGGVVDIERNPPVTEGSGNSLPGERPLATRCHGVTVCKCCKDFSDGQPSQSSENTGRGKTLMQYLVRAPR